MSRHTFFIRAVATITGDITIGYAMASACVWVIQSAALGLFLSFMLWLLAIALSLAMGQHILHPAVAVLLSDRKLDPSLAVTLIRCCGTTRHGLQRLRTTRRPSRRPRASDEALERAKAALVALAEHPRAGCWRDRHAVLESRKRRLQARGRAARGRPRSASGKEARRGSCDDRDVIARGGGGFGPVTACEALNEQFPYKFRTTKKKGKYSVNPLVGPGL
jgi:hypothetical protein